MALWIVLYFYLLHSKIESAPCNKWQGEGALLRALCDVVKDELVSLEDPPNLHQLIAPPIRVDNRLCEHHSEPPRPPPLSETSCVASSPRGPEESCPQPLGFSSVARCCLPVARPDTPPQTHFGFQSRGELYRTGGA